MCNLVGRCLNFGPAASTIRAEAEDQTGKLLLYTGQRYKQANGNHGPEKALPSTFSCSTPTAIYLHLRFSSPIHTTLSLSIPTRKWALFFRAHKPHWSKYSSVPDLPFPTIYTEENTWRHIPEERSFSLILSLHLLPGLHSHSAPQCLARKILFTVRGKYVLFSPFMSRSCIQ
jgi:hypothetical protein